MLELEHTLGGTVTVTASSGEEEEEEFPTESGLLLGVIFTLVPSGPSRGMTQLAPHKKAAVGAGEGLAVGAGEGFGDVGLADGALVVGTGVVGTAVGCLVVG